MKLLLGLLLTSFLMAETGYNKCATCHGIKGESKALGKTIAIGGQPIDTLVQQLNGYKAGTLNIYGLGNMMKSQVKNLNEEEIIQLAEYINSL